MIVWILQHALLAIAFAFVCHGVGALVLRRVVFEDASLRFAAAMGLGYGILGQLLFVLGLAGILTRPNVALLFGAALLWSGGLLARRGTRDTLRQCLGGLKARRSTGTAWIALASAPSLLIAMYPPIGYDATMYHLVFARLFAQSGRLVFADALRFPVFPQIAEMHFTAALLLFGEHAMQLTGWLALPVTAIATMAIVRQAGGGERAALFAAALWLGTPYAVYLSGSGYIDVTLTMFVTLAVACSAPALSGAFAGLAAGTKYHGLFFILTLPPRRRFLAFFAGALLFAAPWYAHIARETGSPLFPYLRAIFGDHEYRTGMDQSLMRTLEDPNREARTVLQNEPPFVSIVRYAFLRPLRWGVSPHSPWIVLLLPLTIAGGFIAPRLRRPLLCAAAYALIVSALDWRFMIVIVPLCAAAIAIVVERLVPSRRATLAIALAFVLPGFAWGALLIARKHGRLPHTPAQREAFVARRIRTYRAVHALGPVKVYVLGASNINYYCPGKCLGDRNGPYRYALVRPLLNDPVRLAEKLRKFGATHLVIDKSLARFTPAPPFRLVYTDKRADAYAIE